MEKWRGKVAVITGASSGIGESVAKTLASNCLIVIALARRVELVEAIAKSSKGVIHAHKCDVSDLNSIKETFKWIEDKFSSISILINNAGKSTQVKVLDPSDDATEKLNSVIETNFTGLVHFTRFGVRLMKKSQDYGLVINIGSVLDSIIPVQSYSIYPATKFAVRAFSEVIRYELTAEKNDKIRVTTISPGSTKTGIVIASGAKDDTKTFKNNPYMLPGDISESVIYIMSTPFNVNVNQIVIRPVMQKL